jgi:hypothetical protein
MQISITMDFSPLLRPTAAAWGSLELVNSMVPTQMGLKPGLVAQAMVLGVPSGMNLLVPVEDFLARVYTQLLLGEALRARCSCVQ